MMYQSEKICIYIFSLEEEVSCHKSQKVHWIRNGGMSWSIKTAAMSPLSPFYFYLPQCKCCHNSNKSLIFCTLVPFLCPFCNCLRHFPGKETFWNLANICTFQKRKKNQNLWWDIECSEYSMGQPNRSYIFMNKQGQLNE